MIAVAKMTDTKHSTVVIWFKSRDCITRMTLHNTTVGRAWVKAEEFGWKRPTWYTPWRYLQLHGITCE